MAGALAGAVSCGRCGLQLAGSVQRCFRCGFPLVPAASGGVVGTYAGRLADVVQAGPGRRYLAVGIDLGLGLLLLALTLVQALTGRLGGVPGAVATGAALVLLLVLQAVWFGLRGRTLGRLLLRQRTVDNLSGGPVPAHQLWRRRGRLVTADLRRGRDPLQPAVRPQSTLADVPTVPPPPGAGPAARRDGSSTPAQAAPADSVLIQLDNGQRHTIRDSLLIGRSPENGFETHPLLAIADLSRALAKTHALLEWSGTVLWVTDLHTSGGTELISPDGERRLLVPGVRGPVGIGWTVRCGDRTFTVRAGTEAA